MVLAVATSFSHAQSQPGEKTKALHSKAPELRLRIVPDKETYVLHEGVFTKTEFLNLTDKTLCFPEPAQGQQVPSSGYLITEGDAPGAQGRDRFIEVFDGPGIWPRERLLSEMEKVWVKVAPNAVYVTKSADAKVDLNEHGRWRLTATYHPPEGSFDPGGYREYLKSAAQSVGCTIPEAVVTAQPVAVNVVSPPKQKQSIK